MRFLLPLVVLLTTSLTAQDIEWLSWEEAIERHAVEPRPILVDVYTDWCGWCKQMDKKVFAEATVASYIVGNFYAVKLNAEQTEDITYDGHLFQYDPTQGRRGVHALAVSLLDGRMSYPSVVYLDENRNRITISPGFNPAERYIHELRYINEGQWREMTFNDYMEKYSK
jgi:thioredoxin-related protein